MAFWDTVKNIADQGSVKLDEMQYRHQMDVLAKKLGYLTYQEQCGTLPPPNAVKKLVHDLYELDLAIYRIQHSKWEAETAGSRRPNQEEENPSPQQEPLPGSIPHLQNPEESSFSTSQNTQQTANSTPLPPHTPPDTPLPAATFPAQVSPQEKNQHETVPEETGISPAFSESTNTPDTAPNPDTQSPPHA